MVPVAAAVTLLMVAGGFFGGKLIAGSDNGSGSGVVSVQQVAGSSQTSSHYPGATVLVNSVGKPNLALTDTAGRPYNVADQTAGRVTLVYFGYTHCPDVCPINMALTALALQRMPAKDRQAVTVVFISTDPSRDTPPVIRAWLDHFDDDFVGLTGTPAQIHDAERAVGMPLSYAVTVASSGSDYQVVHAGYTLVYSQDGIAHLTVDDSETPAQYATTLEHLLSHGYQGA
jgi:protein SCO1/2